MSLSASEQQALDSIEATLTSSDPKLASLHAIFARLASGEEMPVRERVWIHRRLQVTRGWQRKQRCSRLDKAGRHMRSGFQSLGWSQGHAQKAPGRIGRATCPAGTSCLEGVGRQGRGETEHVRVLMHASPR